MEKVIDRPGGVFGHCILQLRQGGRFDIFDALKRLEQLSPPLLPHAGDLVEHRAAHPLVLLLADIAARTLFSPWELATGIMTALVGAPVFIFMASRMFK